MSVHDQLVNTAPVQTRLPWMERGNPNVLSVIVQNGNIAAAANVLEHHATARGLKIVEVARFTANGVDAAFVRGEPNAA